MRASGRNPSARAAAPLVIITAALPSDSGEELPGGDLPVDLREALGVALVEEGGSQSGQGVDRGAGSDDLVGGQTGDRRELVVEQPVLGGAGGLFVAARGEFVELGARQSPLGGNQFGADAWGGTRPSGGYRSAMPWPKGGSLPGSTELPMTTRDIDSTPEAITRS